MNTLKTTVISYIVEHLHDFLAHVLTEQHESARAVEIVQGQPCDSFISKLQRQNVPLSFIIVIPPSSDKYFVQVLVLSYNYWTMGFSSNITGVSIFKGSFPPTLGFHWKTPETVFANFIIFTLTTKHIEVVVDIE